MPGGTSVNEQNNWWMKVWNSMRLGFLLVVAIGTAMAQGLAGASEFADFAVESLGFGTELSTILALSFGGGAFLAISAIVFRALRDEEVEHTHVSKPLSATQNLPQRMLGGFFALIIAGVNSIIETASMTSGLGDALTPICEAMWPGSTFIVKLVALIVSSIILPLQLTFAFNEIKEMLGFGKRYVFSNTAPDVNNQHPQRIIIWYEQNKFFYVAKGCKTEILDKELIESLRTRTFKDKDHKNGLREINPEINQELIAQLERHFMVEWERNLSRCLFIAGVVISGIFGVASGIAGGATLGVLVGGLIGGPPGMIVGGILGVIVGLPTVLASGVSTIVTVSEMSSQSTGFLNGFKQHMTRWKKLRGGIELLNGVGEGMGLFDTINDSQLMQTVFKIPTLGVAIAGAIVVTLGMWMITRGFFRRFIGGSAEKVVANLNVTLPATDDKVSEDKEPDKETLGRPTTPDTSNTPKSNDSPSPSPSPPPSPSSLPPDNTDVGTEEAEPVMTLKSQPALGFKRPRPSDTFPAGTYKTCAGLLASISMHPESSGVAPDSDRHIHSAAPAA